MVKLSEMLMLFSRPVFAEARYFDGICLKQDFPVKCNDTKFSFCVVDVVVDKLLFSHEAATVLPVGFVAESQ